VQHHIDITIIGFTGPTYSIEEIGRSNTVPSLDTVEYDKRTRRKNKISEEIIEFEFCKRPSSNQIARTPYNDIILGLSGQPTDARNETLKHNNVLSLLIPEGD